MKILAINQFASTPKYSTGAGERLYYLSKYFKEKNIEIEIIGASYTHLFLKFPKTKSIITKEETEHANFYWVRTKNYNPSSGLQRTLALFEFLAKLFFLPIKKIGKPDIVLVSSMSILPVYYAIYLKWRYNAKFILEIRDIWPLTAMELGGYSGINPFILFLKITEWIGYKKSDYLVSVLPGFNDYLKEKGFITKPFAWIPNGIPFELSIELSKQSLHPIDKSKFNIIYAGVLGTSNVVENFVSAAIQLKRHTGIHFIILGDGPNLESLKQQAEGLPNITFIRKVNKDQVHSILFNCDLSYYGNRYKFLYNYGISANKLNDYMLAELPILSSSGLFHDPVNKAKCGLVVEAENVDKIVEGILYFYNLSEPERKAIGKKGKEYVLKNQEYSVLANKYINVFEEVLGNPSLNKKCH